MLKRLNKRGQEGFSSVGLTGSLIVGVVLLVVVIAAIWVTSNQAGNASGNVVPSQLEQARLACENVAIPGGLEADYCQKFRQIGSDNYVTCDYLHNEVPGVVFENPLNCDLTLEEKRIISRDACEDRGIDDNTLFDGVACSILIISEEDSGNDLVSADLS